MTGAANTTRAHPAAHQGALPSGISAWIAVGLVWSLLALLSAGQTASFLIYRNEPVPWSQLLVSRLADWYTCALFLPPLFWLARRFPLERSSWRRTLPIQLAASIACVLVKYAVYLPVARALGAPPTITWQGMLARNALTELMIFWAVIGFIHAVEFYARYQEGRTTALRLEAELASAQLEALAAQLRPHFLFNTLSAISELMHQDAAAADRMLSLLSDLLRETLRRPDGHDISLGEEMSLLRLYVEIMKVRFGPRLDIELTASTEAEGARIPAFLLQPIVENAFEHGVVRRRGPALVRVAATVEQNGSSRHVIVTVRDDGPGLSHESNRVGVGLANTRRRLERRYGEEQELVLRELPEGGTEALIRMPYVA